MNLLYLAYGSNLHPLRLQLRVPSAAFQVRALLPGYRLTFSKRGMDGSGKCNIQYTGAVADRVFAAVYSLSPQEISALDRFEGAGYEKQQLELKLAGGLRKAFAYVAPAHHCDERLRPFDWYQQLVFRGACFHGFPPGYLGRLREVGVVKDRDAQREAMNRGLLEQMMSWPAGPEFGLDRPLYCRAAGGRG